MTSNGDENSAEFCVPRMRKTRGFVRAEDGGQLAATVGKIDNQNRN